MGRGTRTAILELKISQELDIINQNPLLLIFLDLCKAYDSVYLECLLTTLEGYGAGTNMRGLLADFWERQEVVTHKNGYHGPHFQATMETTQESLI